jgi:hypothetical protein
MCAHFSQDMSQGKETAANSTPLPLEARKALVADWAQSATGAAKEGAHLIDVRDPSPKERAYGKTLKERARRALSRRSDQKAA